jgi:hypothetical protein
MDFLANPLFHNLFQSDKGSTANKQNIAGINLNAVLIRVLASSLGRNIGDGPF